MPAPKTSKTSAEVPTDAWGMASALPRRAVRASAKALGTSGQAVEQTWALAERDAQQALAKLRGRLNSTLPVVQPWPRGGLNE